MQPQHSNQQSSPDVTLNVGVAGFFKIEAVQPDGSSRVLADWFPNLITNIGLDRWGTGGIVTFCGVGTGTAQPTITDTGLTTPLAFTGTIASTTSTAASGAPYAVTMIRTFTFSQGAVVGNISEVSVGWSGANGTAWSHARIKDGGGVDTTITVTAIEQLSISYQLKLNIPSADVTSNITIGGVATAITVRASEATSTIAWGVNGSALGSAFDIANGSYTGALDGAIGPVTGYPSGTLQQLNSVQTPQAYVGGSFYRDTNYLFPIGAGNFAGGLDSVWISGQLTTRWQIGFVPAVNKDATKTFAFSFRTAWSRT